MKRAVLVLLALSLTAAAFAQQTCDQRPADRDAIRSHIQSIFQAFVDHDGPKLRATHAPQWRGFLQWSDTAIRGIDDYMKNVDGATHPGPNGMKSYKLTEFDCVFYGDSAVVPFISDIESEYEGQRSRSTLRIVDFYVKLKGSWIQAGSDTQAHPQTLSARASQLQTLPPPMKQQLLDAREHVWTAYFANEHSYLERALPPELIAIDPHPGDWSDRDTVLRGSERFAQSGSKLAKIEFPRTEIQAYGNVAQVYSTYVLEFEGPQGKSQSSGRASETFVYRDGQWLNVGWHLDAAKPDTTTAEK